MFACTMVSGGIFAGSSGATDPFALAILCFHRPWRIFCHASGSRCGCVANAYSNGEHEMNGTGLAAAHASRYDDGKNLFSNHPLLCAMFTSLCAALTDSATVPPLRPMSTMVSHNS